VVAPFAGRRCVGALEVEVRGHRSLRQSSSASRFTAGAFASILARSPPNGGLFQCQAHELVAPLCASHGCTSLDFAPLL
jgi:hypothetical protein